MILSRNKRKKTVIVSRALDMRKMFDKSQKLKERSGVIITIEFCGYPRQTRTIWSAHPTAEYLSGVCLMHKQFPCRRRHRQLPIITHLRSRGWTIVVSSNKLGFRVLFKGIKDTRDREPLREDFCSAKRILYVWNRWQRKKEKETEAPGLSTRSCTIAFGCLEGFAATIYPRSTWEDTPEVGDIRSHTAEEHGFTMKFDWHLTVVQLIMVGISYYEISKALNAEFERVIYAASRYVFCKTNTYSKLQIGKGEMMWTKKLPFYSFLRIVFWQNPFEWIKCYFHLFSWWRYMIPKYGVNKIVNRIVVCEDSNTGAACVRRVKYLYWRSLGTRDARKLKCLIITG